MKIHKYNIVYCFPNIMNHELFADANYNYIFIEIYLLEKIVKKWSIYRIEGSTNFLNRVYKEDGDE